MVNTAFNAPTHCASAPERSPFEGHTAGQRPNQAGQTNVQLSASALASFTLINTWTKGLPGLLAALTQVFGACVPRTIGETVQTEFGLLMHSGPEAFLLVGDGFFDRAALLRIVVGTDIGAVTDLSQTRCRIRIQGAQCRTVLNLLFALDMHAQDRDALAFPVGNITMTGTDAAPCTLHRLGLDAFDLYLPSASAPAQLTRVLDAAQAFGVSLQHC